MSRCALCSGQLKPGKITQVYELSKQLIIVRYIPARVCQDCGEGYMNAATVDQLGTIVADMKRLRLETAILDFHDVVPSIDQQGQFHHESALVV